MAFPTGPSHEEMVAMVIESATAHFRVDLIRRLEDDMKPFDKEISAHWAEIVQLIMRFHQLKRDRVAALEEVTGQATARAVMNFDIETMMPSSFWHIFNWSRDAKHFIDMQLAQVDPDRYEREMAELQAERDENLEKGRLLRPGATQTLSPPPSESAQALSTTGTDPTRALSPTATLSKMVTLPINPNRASAVSANSETSEKTPILDATELPVPVVHRMKKRGVSSNVEAASSSKRMRPEPPPAPPLSPVATSGSSVESIPVTAPPPVSNEHPIIITNDPVETWEVEANEFVFEYPAAGEGWFVLRCNMGPDTNVPELGGPGQCGFTTHPFEDSTAYKHFVFDSDCRGHDTNRFSQMYNETEIMVAHGHRVIGPDLDENWVSTSNYMLASKVASTHKASSPQKKARFPDLGSATRTSTPPTGGKTPRGRK